jgi:hypothetical protein
VVLACLLGGLNYLLIDDKGRVVQPLSHAPYLVQLVVLLPYQQLQIKEASRKEGKFMMHRSQLANK